ncbi:helix-turn-helix domain-containing protein [bacterium]|nr:helix-turn-helix domain-containing protein [bacterium]
MNKKEETLLQNFPKHQDYLKQQLRDDPEYAGMWLDSLLEDYSASKDVNDLIYNLKPLIEASYTICDFAKLIGIHRITLYKIFSRKMVPSIEILHKIFSGLGYELKIFVQKV